MARLDQFHRGEVPAALIFLSLLACNTYFLPKWGERDWVANSRADLVYSIADKGTFTIDAYHENTGDKAYYQGHYYAVGSPGPSLVAIPFYLGFKTVAALPPVRNFLHARHGLHLPARPGLPESEVVVILDSANLALWVVTLFAVSVPSAVLGVVLYRFLTRFTPSRQHAAVLALAYGLGTVAFPYSRAFYQHPVAAFGAFVGFFLLWKVVREGADVNVLWLVGLLFGLAAISEYPVALFLGLVFLWGLWEAGAGARNLYRVVLGALPALAFLVYYDVATFGSPFPLGYHHHVIHAGLHSRGLMGLTWPDLAALYGVTFSPYRGLFFLSPFLLLAVPGLYGMLRQDGSLRGVVLLLLALAAGFLLYNSSYGMWWGGSAIGPRFLVPLVPFLMLPAGWAFTRLWQFSALRPLLVLLLALSVLNVWIQTLAGQYYPPAELGGRALRNPLVQFALPHLLAGDVALNLGHFLGLRGLASLLPLLLLQAMLWTLTLAGLQSGVRHRGSAA